MSSAAARQKAYRNRVILGVVVVRVGAARAEFSREALRDAAERAGLIGPEAVTDERLARIVLEALRTWASTARVTHNSRPFGEE